MSSKIGGIGAHLSLGGLMRFIPEPKTSSTVSFSHIARGVASVASQMVPGVAGINGDYLDMINRQIEVQQQMQLVTLLSNIEKSKHETQMAAIRNVRAG